MPTGGTLVIVQSLASSAVFSAVLALALSFTWRLYGQPYLLRWAVYWGLYFGIWSLEGLSMALHAEEGQWSWVVIRSLMIGGAFAARAVLAVGVLLYLGFRAPTRREKVALALAVLGMTAAGIRIHLLVSSGAAPDWVVVPFRTYFVGVLVAVGLTVMVLRRRDLPSRRPLAVALAVAALSDAWDLALELYGASPWTATGEVLFLSYFVVNLTDALLATGMLVAALGTERERAERAHEALRLRDAAIQQAQRQETIGQLAGGLAHDFNNLLTAVIGHLALVRDALPPGSQPTRDAEVATEAAERAARLTRQLLTYARRQPSSPRVLDPNELVGAVDRMAVPLVGPRISRTLRLAPVAWPVRVDPTQLEQLVLNLVVNSRDAMPEGGTLTLETANEVLGPGPRAEDAAGVPAGAWVRITVEDSGEGMDAPTRERMFEPFFTTKPTGRGSGLGLAAAHGIVEAAGGVIGVSTAPGRGTRISVFLPRAENVPAEPLRAVPAPEQQGGGETVLLVEDEAGIRALAARALERRGYNVLSASDGESALRLVESGLDGVSILVTDIAMPGMDGRTLARRLRERRPALAVLFMSGFVSGAPGELEAPLLNKPFTPDALVSRVRQLLDAARPAARTGA